MLSLEKLIQVYTNEKATFKLLQYNRIVDDFNEVLKHHIPNSNSLLNTFEEIELERIKYFVKEYILTRLDKIRDNLFVDDKLMSYEERLFKNQYKEMLINANIFADKPSKEYEIVGFIAQKKLEAVKIDGQIVEILPGDFFVANFDEIINYLEDDSAVLV